ncbi:branched-chain amino acid ABC transporter permease [Conexibacter sp. DBS9H8]|uniref:branched-chain amino acid ABC transporter permease n=1 Tax=Conexibacter sp. DBS9H8 TaxID=2937801 RepID=UPI0020104308|nr:branched-chain amino acid ABC transporter permease [Conexibacter sp. DBS9H8]
MNLTTLGVGIASGIGLGSAYALVAVSFTLIVASTGYFIFALESLVSIGGVLTYVLSADAHLPMLLVGVLVCIGGLIAGAALDVIARRPFEGRTTNIGLVVLLASIGLSIAIDATVGLLFGSNTLNVPGYVSANPLIVDGVAINPAYVVMFGAIVVLTIVSEFVFRRTSTGRNLRATQLDSEGVRLLGLNVGLMTTCVFGVSGLLAMFAGYLLTPITSASATTGSGLVIPAFAALAIGGFGSFRGAIGGSIAVGLVVGIVPLYMQSAYVDPILLAAIVLVLLVRPQGLFGTTAARAL